MILSQPSLNGDANYRQRTKDKKMVTRGARTSRGRWRRAKSKRKLERAGKNPERNTSAIDECERTDRLLLSALRYWEVEHDLIEERVAAIRSATAVS